MLSERTAQGVVVRAPAKVNLFLEVLGKRPDGYHDLATLMVVVGLYDTLEFKEESSAEVALELAVPPGSSPSQQLSTGPDNLICRAAERLRRHAGYRGGARIRLHKRIPMQAGLAGGSADAAATLIGLNRLWGLRLTTSELSQIGAELGSDVPFFFAAPAAWCTGRGEVTTPLRPARSLWLVLLSPPQGLSTAAVFRVLTPPAAPLDGRPLAEALEAGDFDALAAGLHNRLQPVAEALCPLLATLRQRLAAAAPSAHLMSGSGSTLFALCPDREEARRVYNQLTRDPVALNTPEADLATGLRVLIVRSCF